MWLQVRYYLLSHVTTVNIYIETWNINLNAHCHWLSKAPIG